jgi:hypothetical protein
MHRSRTLAAVTGCYFVIALVVSPFTNGGVTGGSTGSADVGLGAIRLIGLAPGLILLGAGVVAWLSTRRHQAPAG